MVPAWPIATVFRFAALLLVFSTVATAKPPPRFVQVSVEQGLSQSTVQAILQDHVGFLWFGTEEGLNRYDGYSFKVYKHDPNDPHSLSDSVVSALYEDRHQRFWVGTEHGLCRFDPRTERFTPVPAIRDRVGGIIEGRDGTIWVAAIGGGLFLLRPGSDAWVSYQPDPKNPASLGSYRVGSLLEDRQGRIWVGLRDKGLDCFDPRNGSHAFVHYRHRADDPNSLGHEAIWGLAEDAAGKIWIASYTGGLDVLDPATGVFRHYRHRRREPESLATDMVTAVFADRSGRIWVGTDGTSLSLYDPASDGFVVYPQIPGDAQSLSSNVVRTLYEDKQGSLWVGTFQGGANQLKRPRDEFAFFSHDPADPASLSDRAVASFVEDAAGTLWLGTEEGWINRFDRATQTFQRFRFPRNSAVLALHCDRRNRIWAGSYRGGLARFDPENGTFTVYRHDSDHPKTLSDDEVWTIAGADDGSLWLGTNTGLDRFDPETGEVTDHFQIPRGGGLISTGVRALHFDGAGNLWIGSFAGLAMRPRDGGAFVAYEHREGDLHSLSNDTVVGLHEDAKGRFWIGTLGGGLKQLDRATGQFTSYHHFPSNVIHAILEDASGHLWLSTNHGLSRFSPDTGATENYDLTNGLQTLQFHLGAGLRTRDGRLLFGSIDGFYDLDPAAIKPSTFAPPVLLTGVRILNAPARLPAASPTLSEMTLEPADRIVTFEFAALDYTFPRRNQYAYQLSGFSEEWINLGSKRELTFTNLDPGDYVLRIKASNADGVWPAGSRLTLGLTVIPPFWRTWWFRGVCVLGLVGCGWSLHRLRVRRLRMMLFERRQSERALRESEERFARAFQASPAPMAIVRRKDATLVDVNSSLLRLTGYERAELLGRNPRQLPLLSPAEIERVTTALAVQPTGPRDLDLEIRTRSGEMRAVLASAEATELAGDSCFLVVATDITDRRRTEAALRDSEERYRRFFEEDLAGAFISTPEGGLLACNPAFVRMFGFASAAEAMAGDVFSLYPEPGIRAPLLARLIREHKIQDLEQEMRRRDGKPLHVAASVIGTFNARGELVEIKGYVIDMTEHKRLEAQLRQSQKMEAVGQLAGGVAHDFNNLLTGIIGYTDLLLMTGNLDEETSSTLQEIRGAGRRAAALTRQLLAFSRRQLLQPRVLDLNLLITDMENMLRRLIGEDIDLRIGLASDVGRIKADRSQIEQVILNLAVNARDAMPRGGRLLIETSNVVLNAEYTAPYVGLEPGNYVRLAVSDSGCGMSPEVQARIFEPFFTTKGVGKGTGLGLSTVYGIVKQSSGHITFYSELGAGTAFKIYLPRVDALHAHEEPDRSRRKLPRGQETVLLVEDNEIVRRATNRILQRNGYKVLEAVDADDAIAIHARAPTPVHLLLTDVIMPGRNGRELAEQLRARDPALCVVFMSGYTDDAISRHGGLDAGFVFVEKPFTPDSLISKIHEALQDRQTPDDSASL